MTTREQIEALADEVKHGRSRSSIDREHGKEAGRAVREELLARRDAAWAAEQARAAAEGDSSEDDEPIMVSEDICSRCGCIVHFNEPVAEEDAPCEVWCEKCTELPLRQQQADIVMDALYALGWRVQGVSGRSEACYYAHPDVETRIRIARHDAVYESSQECIQVGIGSDTVDAHVHVDADDLDAEACAEAAVEASRLARRRESKDD